MTLQGNADVDVVRSLMLAAGAAGPPAHTDVEVVEYDWQVPSHFSRDQLGKVDQFGAALAEGLSAALGGQLGQELRFQSEPVGQHFHHRLVQTLAGEGDFRVVLGSDGEAVGMMLLSGEAGAAWVARLLGASPGDPRELLGLEAELLTHAARTLVGAISQTLQEAGGQSIGLIGPVSTDPTDLPGENEAEYCLLSLRTDAPETAPEIRLAVLCELLDTIVGEAGRVPSGRQQAADSRPAMEEHFGRVPITAAVMVGYAELTVRELMNLEVGDVIVLPTRLNDPIQLCVGRNVVSAGRAVVSGGKCGIEISRLFSAAGPVPATRAGRIAD
ncbi:MAG TPA: FliM/FliN family flagellar motor switch protein [Phycisphaerae bacterium]|nr:FliM/FliN family flagellar motor switch protein [Phycisphaerae bacterium]